MTAANTLPTMTAAKVSNSYANAKQTDPSKIPVVDIGTLIDGSDIQSVAEKIGQVCEDIGFLYVVNHGVSDDLLKRMKLYTKRFFDLPMAEKEHLNIVKSGLAMRGYVPTNCENVDPENTKDHKEAFELGKHYDEIEPFFGPNLMPRDELNFPEFKETMEEFCAAMRELARQLIGAISVSLDLPFDYFDKKQQKAIAQQRITHYPGQTGDISREKIGIGEHTDYGFLTIVTQEDVGGLQIKCPHTGQWINATPIDGTFVVNIGDLLQTITNDRYKSTLHRVINAGVKDRYSYQFFMHMDWDAIVEPVPSCVSEDNPAKYEPYTCGSHKYTRTQEAFPHLPTLENLLRDLNE